jgi:hypothetical protein
MQIYKPQRDGIDSSLIVGLPFKHAVNLITIEGVVYNLLLHLSMKIHVSFFAYILLISFIIYEKKLKLII